MMANSNKIMVLFAICGILAPALDFVMVAVIASFQPGYSHMSQYMSELGVPCNRMAAVISIWWIVYGVMLAGFAYGLNEGMNRTKGGWIGPALVAVFAVLGGIGSGIFPCDAGCRGENFSGLMHDILNGIAAFAIVLSPSFIRKRMKNDDNWNNLCTFTLAILILGFTAFVLFVYTMEIEETGSTTGMKGAAQRLFFGVYYIWLVVMGLRLLKLAYGDSSGKVSGNISGNSSGNTSGKA